MEKGTLKYIDSDTTVHEIFSTTDAELVSYDNNGTDTTIANFLDNLSFDTAETADVAEKAEKDSEGNVITSTYAPKNSPNFTGTPTAPTASDLDLLTNQIATVAWCNNVFKRFTGIVPENMDTLQEFWDALGHDSDLATTLSTELAKKQDKTDKLTAFSNLTLSADKLILATGENSFSTTALTTTGKNIISSYTDKDIRKALGVYKNLIYDECENVWKVFGNPKVSGGKLILDGSESYIQSNFTVNSTGTYTAENFINVNSSAGDIQHTIFMFFTDSTHRIRCWFENGDNARKIGFLAQDGGTSTYFYGDALEFDRDYHVAVTFGNGTAKIFVDGELYSQHSNFSFGSYDYTLCIGRGSLQNFSGTIDEFRFSNICRYTENFTPAERFEVDEHTLSLLHFD